MENAVVKNQKVVISSNQLLGQWQGHRRLTRRVIEAFPEDKLFNYSIGGMRTFSALAMEMIEMVYPGVQGLIDGNWKDEVKEKPKTKEELLNLWDAVTERIDRLWPLIPIERFQTVEAAFGLYEDALYSTVLYFIDNEIHHRGQGYVYLRSLGITPPAFYER
ncbi:MAG: damage-inducible protein DinB [Sporocytophaga sp.]|uniref:DinB family protein n=1 Tax=Sporocytophaga sp. TaxID=2231183 RepID=UPI001B102203|nr:DinB family protein [Sporocytophaga sp.]MBO9702353.1 damage-inducible protein DinB [Sporocytophaga sp.]